MTFMDDNSRAVFANLRFAPRPYQVAAFKKWQQYLQHPDRPVQLLFNMATGSGKTYLMAALMLDLYLRGYRDFIFFVNSTNILEKTRDNFLNLGSPKYLFQPNIVLQGNLVRVREVSSFVDSDPTAINIIFTTTQRLHADLNEPHENRLTFSDLEKLPVVLIGDEAHHNNAKILRAGPKKRSWEDTIEKILSMNSDMILLEFTATMDLDNQSIYQKYASRLLYQYSLREFRRDRYSKEVLLHVADTNLERRMLQAIIISEYRQLLAQQHNITLKPVVMFKSRTIFENQTNLRKFVALLAQLQPEQIAAEEAQAEDILQHALQFLYRQGITYKDFCRLLQQDFAPEHLLRIDGGRAISASLQQQVNTLELPANPHRAIFAVDMLKEGWDVLNLFDIVRLYETHDPEFEKTGQPGKTAISEAQLIGRGARYCPLTFEQQVFTQRQFDDSENELRVLEQLHYHSLHDVRYISEIKLALDQSGITDFIESNSI